MNKLSILCVILTSIDKNNQYANTINLCSAIAKSEIGKYTIEAKLIPLS